jgi:hypothetical protein
MVILVLPFAIKDFTWPRFLWSNPRYYNCLSIIVTLSDMNLAAECGLSRVYIESTNNELT